ACPAERQRQQLVAEADAENRLARPDQLAQHRHGISSGRRRVAGAVRQEDAVGPTAQNILGRSRGRDHGYPAAVRSEHSEDVALRTVIDGDNMMARVALRTVAALAV